MELRLLNREELTELYRGELVHVFPGAELKPLAAMLRLLDMGRYEPLLAVEEGEAVGYALLWLTVDGRGPCWSTWGSSGVGGTAARGPGS